MRHFLIGLVLTMGLISCSSEGTVLEEETPTIFPPVDLAANNITATSVELSWTILTNITNLERYRVFQDGEQIVEVAETNHTVTDLEPETTYVFTVSRLDGMGNESQQSVAITVVTLAEETPQTLTAPVDLTADNITSTEIQLSWSTLSNTTSMDRYLVYQDGEQIAEVQETNHTVTNLEPEITYIFAVSALDGAGNESELSDSVSVTTAMGTASQRPKVLVFTKTEGFDHNTRVESEALVRQIADEQDFEVVVDDEGTEFDSLENLQTFDVIFFTNTSGNTLNQNQRDNVESYAAQGGHFMSNHAASDGYGHSTASTVNGNGKGVWDWYAENVTGCSVRNGPNHTAAGFPATVTVENANGALTMDMVFPWNDEEEWYYWEGGYLNPQFTELLRVSETGNNSFDIARMTSHYWERPDGGLSFYTSMGHAQSKYQDGQFVQLLSNVFDLMLE